MKSQMSGWRVVTAAAFAVSAIGSTAFAEVTITPGASAPTYTDHVIDFDQATDPAGSFSAVSTTYWHAEHGITFEAGDVVMGGGQVHNWDTFFGGGWLGTDQSLRGPFGQFMSWDAGMTAVSFQAWSDAGAPGPFGGGMSVHVYSDGELVANTQVTPAWGGIGDMWFSITATDGDTFDRINLIPSGGSNHVISDNYSWDEAATAPCTGDTNGDGMVDVNDLNNIFLDWGSDGSANGGDVTGQTPGSPADGIVDVNDLNAVITAWGLCS